MYLLFTLAWTAFGQPVIFEGGVRNAASNTPPGHLNSGLARGAVASIRGRDLAAVDSVRIAGMEAQVLSVSANRITAIIPPAALLGAAQVTVSANGMTSNAETIQIVQRNFGIFTQDGSGAGPAILQPANDLFHPAHPGDLVTITGTGLGPGFATVTVRVGFRDARVSSQGPAECCPGVDAISFEIPVGVEGCYVPFVVIAGEPSRAAALIPDEGAISNSATLPIASSTQCEDPTGFTGAELDALRSGTSMRIAAIQLDNNAPNRFVAAKATVAQYDAAALLQSLNILGLPAPGTCLEVSYENPGNGTPLDAGPIAIAGVRRLDLAQDAPGSYGAAANPALPAGAYTLEIGETRVPFELPSPIVWTNKTTRLGSNQHTYFWTGGDPEGYVIIADLLSTRIATFGSVCVQKASAGRFTVPAPEWYGGLMEGRAAGPLAIGVTLSSIGKPVRFTAPGVDAGFLLPRSSDSMAF